MSVIPIQVKQLSASALAGVIDEFIAREGTDYGHQDYSLEQKRQSVLNQLESGNACICYDPVTETTSIVDSDQIPG